MVIQFLFTCLIIVIYIKQWNILLWESAAGNNVIANTGEGTEYIVSWVQKNYNNINIIAAAALHYKPKDILETVIEILIKYC